MNSFVACLQIIGSLLLGLTIVSCQPEPKSSSQRSPSESPSVADTLTITDEHWLFVRLNTFGGRYTLTINGFPVEREIAPVQATGKDIGARINTALIHGKNTAAIHVRPFVEQRAEDMAIHPIDVRLWIARYATDGTYVSVHSSSRQNRRQGEEPRPTAFGTSVAQVDSAHAAWSQSARRQWQTYRETVGAAALDSLRAWARLHPMTVRTTFDNEHGPDFSDLFEEAPIIEGTPADSARLRAYAMHLRNLMENQRADALYQEFLPRNKMLRRENGKPPLPPDTSAYRQEGLKNIRTHWFERDFLTDFQASDIRLTRWVDGRIWQIERGNGLPLFVTDTIGSRGEISIYVAEINDTLKVVR